MYKYLNFILTFESKHLFYIRIYCITLYIVTFVRVSVLKLKIAYNTIFYYNGYKK